MDKLSKLKFKGICEDARCVKKGDIFFVRERPNFDIFSCLPQIDKQVAGFVVEDKNKGKLPKLIKPVFFVKDLKSAYHDTIDRFYKVKAKDFTFIAVTGTNGKTTTTFIIHHILTQLGVKAALIGTVKYLVGKKSYPSTHTTPDYLALRRLFKVCKDHKVTHIVMEASSHGIEQGRVSGIGFSSCVFTNLTRDHLDYHKTFENYFAAKQKLFFDNPDASAVVNLDDEHGRQLIEKCKRVISFGAVHKADLFADNINLTMKGTSFDIVYKGRRIPFMTSFLGRHNVHNILSAIGALLGLKFKLEDILQAFDGFKYVPGRMEEVSKDIFVDYAHTPDGLEQVLKTLRECGYHYIISVFGCGGDRDKGKRPMMGRISCQLADYSVVTSDNPRSEPPQAIIDDVIKGFDKSNFISFEDREKAIKYAIDLKKKHKHSCLLVAGKGHEDYQVIAGEKIPYSDQKVIRKVLRHAGK